MVSSLTKSVLFLEYYNKWRTGADVMQPNPSEISNAIDNIIGVVNKISAMSEDIKELKKIAKQKEELDFLLEKIGYDLFNEQELSKKYISLEKDYKNLVIIEQEVLNKYQNINNLDELQEQLILTINKK